MLLVPLLGALGCTAGENAGPGDLQFALPAADLGAARASATGFDPADGDATGLVLDSVLPVFGETVPLWEAPQFVWALLQRDTVRSQGQCPFERIDDGATVYEGDCRSSFGYDFTGDVSEREWTVDGVDHYRLEADVEVVGDVENPLFTRIVMRGAVERAVPEDGSVSHYDVNLEMALEGYDATSADEERLTAWSEWAVSGTAEESGGSWAVGLAAEVAGSGGMSVTSAALAESTTCPIELDGEATLGEGVSAAFTKGTCDACATVTHAGGETEACRPD